MDYSHIQLTDEEIQAAITEGKKRKWFHERNVEHWIKEEQAAIARHEEDKRIAREKRKQ